MPFPPPSALHGLVLNIAGLEMGEGTPGAEGEACRLASASIAWPQTSTLYQHLHVLPVGSSGDSWKAHAKGNKHFVSPALRQILCKLEAVCVIDSPGLEPLLTAAFSDHPPRRRGLPFLGDNNFFPERLDLIAPSRQALHWLVPSGPSGFPLTTHTDHSNSSLTRVAHYRLQKGHLDQIPDAAWVDVGSPPIQDVSKRIRQIASTEE